MVNNNFLLFLSILMIGKQRASTSSVPKSPITQDRIFFPDDLSIIQDKEATSNLPFIEKHNSEFHRIHGIPLPAVPYYHQQQHNHRCCKTTLTSTTEKPVTNKEFELPQDENSTIDTPVSFFDVFNNSTVNDLLVRYFDEPEDETSGDDILIEDRFATSPSERSVAKVAELAKCIPELQTIRIAPPDELGVVYIPTCTRIERCGGCCYPSSVKSCQPIENTTEIVPLKIWRASITPGLSKLKVTSKQIVLAEKHTQCQCKCIKKETDCHPNQIYVKSDCQCKCNNTSRQKACHKNPKKIWNSNNCTCECRENEFCTSGTVFDTNSCNCIKGQSGAGEITDNDFL